jgi:hypothetical protein
VHLVEALAESFDFFAVLGPVAGALRIDGALIMGLRLAGERGQLR